MNTIERLGEGGMMWRVKLYAADSSRKSGRRKVAGAVRVDARELGNALEAVAGVVRALPADVLAELVRVELERVELERPAAAAAAPIDAEEGGAA